MRIIKIGTWTKEGNPTGWELGCNAPDKPDFTAVMTITADGKVLVDRVEIVEWSKARRVAMED